MPYQSDFFFTFVEKKIVGDWIMLYTETFYIENIIEKY